MKRTSLVLFLVLFIAAGCSVNNVLEKTILSSTGTASSSSSAGITLPADFDVRLDGIWVIGGTNSSGMVSNLDLYNPYTDEWQSNVTTMMAPVRNFSAAAYGTKIYIFGGINGNNVVTNLVQIYDVISNTWIRGTNLPAVRQGHGSVAFGARIYVFGGSSTVLAGGGVQTVYQFNPTVNTNPWSASLGNLVYANTVMDFGYTVFNDEIIYGGGRSTGGTISSYVSSLIPLTSTYQWNTGLLKQPRSGVCAASYNTPSLKYAFFIGGCTTNGTAQFPSPIIIVSDRLCVYFPYSEQGIRVVLAGPRLNQGRAYAQACVKGNALFVFGGLANSTTFLGSVEALDIASLFTAGWQNRSVMPAPRAGFCAVTLR